MYHHPPYGGMGAFGGMPGYPGGMQGQWGGMQPGKDDGHSMSSQSEIDRLVTSNKFNRDGARIEHWCSPLPFPVPTQVIEKRVSVCVTPAE